MRKTMKFSSTKNSAKLNVDSHEINKFYGMLLKMKKKRPHMNINWIMSGIYGIDYLKYINN